LRDKPILRRSCFKTRQNKIKVGTYIFPGWYRGKGANPFPRVNINNDSEWRLIAKFPSTRPVLGFYDDSLLEEMTGILIGRLKQEFLFLFLIGIGTVEKRDFREPLKTDF